MNSKISIGGFEWAVEYIDRTDTRLNGAMGSCHYERRKIYIANDLEGETKHHTLKHEMAHAIIEETHFNNVISEKLGDYYEVFIDSLGRVLMDTDLKYDTNCSAEDLLHSAVESSIGKS